MYKKENKEITDPEKAREAALKLLDFQDRTAYQLTQGLMRKGCSPELAAMTVENLVQAGLVDDLRYACLFIRSGMENGKGGIRLRQKLKEKGVASDVTDRAFSILEEEGLLEDQQLLCLRKALGICGLSGQFEVSSDGYIYPSDQYGDGISDGSGREMPSLDSYGERIDYFGRKLSPEEKDRMVIRRERDRARASLTRKLVTAGFSPSMALDAVKKIGEL